MRAIIRKMRLARMAIMLILALLTTQSVQAADKTALNTAIGDAEAYMATIQESTPSVASTIQFFIDVTKQVQGRQASQPARARVYINNGKKVANK